MDSWWLVSGVCHINDDGDSEIQGSSTCGFLRGVILPESASFTFELGFGMACATQTETYELWLY